MQLQTIVIAALAAVAAASPYEEKHGHGGDKDHGHGGGHGRQCKPATYQCAESHGKPAWNVCDTSGKWVVSIPSPLPAS